MSCVEKAQRQRCLNLPMKPLQFPLLLLLPSPSIYLVIPIFVMVFQGRWPLGDGRQGCGWESRRSSLLPGQWGARNLKKKDNKDFLKQKKKKRRRPSASQTLTIPTVCEGETEWIIAPGHVRTKQILIPITLGHVHKTICGISAAMVQGPGWWKTQNQAWKHGDDHRDGIVAATRVEIAMKAVLTICPMGKIFARKQQHPRSSSREAKSKGNASPPRSPCTLFLVAENSDEKWDFQEVDDGWAGLWLYEPGAGETLLCL